jgi:electron transfer flavoprotein alpha subunit
MKKALLIGESRGGSLLESTYELLAFAGKAGLEKAVFLVGDPKDVPHFDGRLYFADVATHGEYNPDRHKKLVEAAIQKENPDYVVFLHSSYGCDLAPRVAASGRMAQVSGVVNLVEGKFELSLFNGKMRRIVVPRTPRAVLTLQAGAFSFSGRPEGSPQIETVDATDENPAMEFCGYDPVAKPDVDLAKAEVIICVGWGIGKKENIPMVAELAKTLGGEIGASRPVVDSGWVDHSRQIGITGQVVAPKLYIGCGISGAIQHIAGMKRSGFIVAINKDKEAPIGEIADVLVVANVEEFLPVLTEKLRAS